MPHSILYLTLTALLFASSITFASGTMTDEDLAKVERADIINEEQRQRLSITAGLLADYEILSKKLLVSLEKETVTSDELKEQGKELLTLSEDVIESARFRLPQCEEYLAKTLALKDELDKISHETLEKDYHHDGALPKAAPECYHTKDLFVHPATVVVLTRDDPLLNDETKSSINAEITEVLAHTELVRQLIIY